MIDKLTEYQEKQIQVYYQKWYNIGISCQDFSDNKIKKIIKTLYENINKKEPLVLILNNIWQCIVLYNLLEDSQIQSPIWEQIWAQIDSQIWAQKQSQIRAQIQSQIRSQIDSQIDSQIWAQIESQIWSQIQSQKRSQIQSQIQSQIGTKDELKYPEICYGQHNASRMGWYDYFYNIFNFKCKNKKLWKSLIDITQLHWFIPCENLCIVSRKPEYIQINNSHQLHADEKPAVHYKDDYNIYALNAIRVPSYIAMTPYDKLSAKKVLDEKNVDVRREGIKKIGIHRCIEQLNPVILDTWNDYELFKINFTGQDRIYLKMKNPSCDTWHIEGVHPSCDTCRKALAWRDNEKEYIEPNILT